MDIHESIKKSRSRLEMDYEIGDWLSLDHFPDDTRVNLTPRGRRFIFQKGLVLKNLEPVVSRAQWSRYRSNPEMSIPLSTLRLLLPDKHELFMTSFTVTSIGNKKIQLPIKLPIKTRNNSLAKLLALFTLSRNVFMTGTYQTDNYSKMENLIETFEEVFDVNLCPEDEIAQNQRGYYVKIPVQICSALVKTFTGDYKASFPQIILSVAKCKDEQDILDFVRMWLKFSRVYRGQEHLFRFRATEETQELVKLLEKLGVRYETGSIIERDSLVPFYHIPNVADNELILGTPSVVSRLKSKIENQNARIKELETIKDDLESKLRMATDRIPEKLTWSRGYEERLAEELAEKIAEFERILLQSKQESEKLEQLLRDDGTILSDESILSPSGDQKVVADIAQLREEVDSLKERLSTIYQNPSSGKELSYKVTQEITMKSDQPVAQIGSEVDLRKLVKIMLAVPENWILFVLGAKQRLTKDQISKILGIPANKRLDLQKRLNDYIDKHILKHEVNSEGEEVYSIDQLEWSDLISNYTTTLLSNKDLVPLEVRQQVRRVLR